MKTSAKLSAVAVSLALALWGCAVWNDDYDEDNENDVSSSSVLSEVKLDDLIAKMREASDPKSNYLSCQSYLIKQRMEKAPGDRSPTYMVEVMFKKPDFFKTNTYTDNKLTSAILYRSGRAWSIDPATGENTEIKDIALEQIKLLCAMGHPEKTIKDVFDKVDIYECVVGLKEYYKLVCRPKCSDLKNYSIYVGKNNFLTKMVYGKKYVGSDFIDYASVLDKYALKDDVMVASETTIVMSGNNNKYLLVDYQINPVIPDSEFELPVPWYQKL